MINDFNESLAFGANAEKQLKDHVNRILSPHLDKLIRLGIISRPVIYGASESSTEKQRKGIDGELFMPKAIQYEVKSRRYYYYKYRDILLETWSVKHQKKQGWFYTCKSDVLLYVWWNSDQTQLVDGYLLFLPELRKHFCDCIDDYPSRIAPNATYDTENRVVKLSQFPKHLIWRFDLRLLFEPSEEIPVLFQSLYRSKECKAPTSLLRAKVKGSLREFF